MKISVCPGRESQWSWGVGQQRGAHSLIGEGGRDSSMIQQGEQQWFVLSISPRASVSISADLICPGSGQCTIRTEGGGIVLRVVLIKQEPFPDHYHRGHFFNAHHRVTVTPRLNCLPLSFRKRHLVIFFFNFFLNLTYKRRDSSMFT